MLVLNSEPSFNFFLMFSLILLSLLGATHHMIMCLILHYLLIYYQVLLEMCYRMGNVLEEIRLEIVLKMVLRSGETNLISCVTSQ